MKYETLAAQITTLGGLLNSTPEEGDASRPTGPEKILGRMGPEGISMTEEKEMKDGSKTTIATPNLTILSLIEIMGHDTTDPILLTAVCTFAFDVFENDLIREDEVLMGPFAAASKNMVELMPYLGGKKYPGLLERTRKYHAASEEKKVSDSGQIDGDGDT